MEYGILSNLTKDYILQHINQEDIFERYLHIKIDTKNLFCSPFRRDNNPTCSFHYNANGKLRLRDWSGAFWGDCFDAVGYLLRVNPNTKQGFAVILDTIAREFRLHKYSREQMLLRGETVTSLDANIPLAATKKAKRIIQYKVRNWFNVDRDFWYKGNITREFLKAFNVFPAQYIWLDKVLLYTFNANDPAYVYDFGNGNIRCYFPKRKTYRFISNCSPLQGGKQITCDNIGLITKSYKDVISLRTFGIQAVAPSSESVPISRSEYFVLNLRFNHLFSLMDYDYAGIKMARKLRKLYGIQPLFFSSNKYSMLGKHFPNHGIKDFFDFVSKYGREETFSLIETTKDKFSSRFEAYEQENLKFLTYLAVQDFYDERKKINTPVHTGENTIPSISL